MDKFYCTTAIIYVNALPHVGHAYEMIATDALARYKRLTGHDVWFLTGTDENSLNAERKARELGLEPQVYVDQMVEGIKEVWAKLDISYDDFIRTTDDRHKRGCQDFFMRVYNNGDIYKGRYEGWYCVSCEVFYPEGQLVEGKCPVHQTTPEWMVEENYFFALSRYQERLLRYIAEHPDFIQPETRRNEIVSFIESGLEDFSISRSSTRWGIPTPTDPAQVIYVWFDALLNYVTAAGYPHDMPRFEYLWPADVHIIGKDITRFHCIYWPAMLMSAGLPLPRQVFGHGFIYLKGERMSKTRGNIVDPAGLVDEFGVDAIRYFLLREVPFGRDGDFVWESLVQRYNADLANDLGNLLNRSLTMLHKYFAGEVPAPSIEGDLEKDVRRVAAEAVQKVERAMQAYQFSDALVSIWELVTRANRYIEEAAPWVLAKQVCQGRPSGQVDQVAEQRLASTLYCLAEVLRLLGHLVWPFIPEAAQKMADQLNVPLTIGGDWAKTISWGGVVPGTRIGTPQPIFPRLEAGG